MCDFIFALGWDKDCYVHCFGYHNHPEVSEKKCSILQYCPTVSCTSRARAKP